MPLIKKIKITYPKNYQDQINLINKIKNISDFVEKIVKNYRNKIHNFSKLKEALLRDYLTNENTKQS